MSILYAAAAAARTNKSKKQVNFVYTDSVPTASVPITRSPLAIVVNPNLFTTITDAQKQINGNDENLTNLDTSAELNKYAVSKANGSIVRFHHQDNVGMVWLPSFLSLLLWLISR